MLSEVPPHEKIRFRRGDIASLDRLPSAVPPVRPPISAYAPRGVAKVVAVLVGALAVLVALVVCVVLAGLGDERLRIEAQAALEALAGEGMAARIGGAGVAFDGFGGLALEVGDARIAAASTQAQIVHVGSVRFGLRLAPLLRGAVEIGRVRLSGARLDISAMPRSGATLGPPFFDADGLFDADAARVAVFAGAQRLVETFRAGGVDRIELEDVEIALPGGGEAGVLRIASAVLQSGEGGVLTLVASLDAGGRAATLEGEIASVSPGGAVETLSLRLAAPAGEGEPDGPFGSATVTIAGARAAAGGRFTLSGRVGDARLPLGREGVRADIALDAIAEGGSGKVEVERLRVAVGRSAWNFHGAVGPAPAGDGPDAEPSYRFELVSDGSTVAPADSPEPALAVVARVAGRFGADARRFDIGEIGVRSRRGEVRGEAALRLEPGASPGVAFRLEVETMPVSQAKQLWPSFSAPSARSWVLANVFGGSVEEGWVEMDVPPGRLGNGVPLGPEEVRGRFVVRGTRFDVAGRIPPVRDANGAIDFRGTDVDIMLDSGTAYSSSGRTVDAENGRLAIRDAHIRPVIGRLDIEVEGDADAILEMAGYEPIAVGRFIDLNPEELSGKVAGTVAADIPLQRGVPVESLDWRVEFAYEELTLARAFEGQIVTRAAGSIVVDPARAVIDARAMLNDAPATLHLVEPLGSDKTGRQRRVAMQMDDAARKALAPGLDMLLSGPAQVEMDSASAGGPRAVRIGLDRATLSIPWVGWSKGGGVPATAAFAMLTKNGRTELSDFRLDGDSFAAAGALSLVGGALERARFPSARLNRGDDFSVDVQARGRGYAVSVRGRSLDVRSAIKLHMKDSEAESSSGPGTPVTVDLEVASVTGFHGEVLSNVKFSYSGTGGRTDRLEFSGTTSAGRPVTYRDVLEGDARTLAMRSTDAGAVLRFLDVYEHMRGGTIELSLAGRGDGPLSGQVDARDFHVVNEPRLSSIVSTAPQGDGRSLNQAVRAEIDTSRVQFERGFARIVKGRGTLSLDGGVLRGPLIGMSFQGTLYDRQGNMALTGTFMPAYGLNRIFGEIPLIGQILGNGRDRGLIGITFRLAGKVDEPQLQVNPLSVIAPGIFRSVFEFR